MSGKEAHTDARLNGYRERLAEETAVGGQACDSTEHEDTRTLWVSLDERGQRWKEWLWRRLERAPRGPELHYRSLPELAALARTPRFGCRSS